MNRKKLANAIAQDALDTMWDNLRKGEGWSAPNDREFTAELLRALRRLAKQQLKEMGQ